MRNNASIKEGGVLLVRSNFKHCSTSWWLPGVAYIFKSEYLSEGLTLESIKWVHFFPSCSPADQSHRESVCSQTQRSQGSDFILKFKEYRLRATLLTRWLSVVH